MKIDDTDIIQFALSTLYAIQLWQLAQLVTHALVLGGATMSLHRFVYASAAEAHLDSLLVPYGLSFSIRRAPNRLIIDPSSRAFRIADNAVMVVFWMALLAALAGGGLLIYLTFDTSTTGFFSSAVGGLFVALTVGHLLMFAMRVRVGAKSFSSGVPPGEAAQG